MKNFISTYIFIVSLVTVFTIGCSNIKQPSQPNFLFNSTPADTVYWQDLFTETELYWGSVQDESSVSYNVYRVWGSIDNIDSVKLITNVVDTFYVLLKPPFGYYRYGVQAQDSFFNKSNIALSPVLGVIDNIPPPTPENVGFRFKPLYILDWK